jgi:hypothetical protein
MERLEIPERRWSAAAKKGRPGWPWPRWSPTPALLLYHVAHGGLAVPALGGVRLPLARAPVRWLRSVARQAWRHRVVAAGALLGHGYRAEEQGMRAREGERD